MAVAETQATSARRLPGFREPVVRGLQLLVLSGFALAQPLFDILGKNAEFFAVRGSTPSDIVLFALAVTFVPALVLLAVELLVGLVDGRAAFVLHLVFAGFLVAVFAVQAFQRLGLEGTVPLIAASTLAGVAGALALWRVSAVRTFLTVLAPAPLVFLALFLFNSNVEALVFPEDVEVRTAGVRAETPVVVVVFDELPVISLLQRNGEIDARRFPNFARLARASTWFRNASSQSASTTVAVPSLLSGKDPQRGKLPVFQQHPDNLFTLLGGGYRMHVQESQTRLCPSQLCRNQRRPEAEERLSSLWSDARIVYLHLVSPPALEDELPAIDESWGNFGDEVAEASGEPQELTGETLPDIDIRTFYIGRVREWKAFMNGIRRDRGGRPSLHFLHTLLPHGPWLYFPTGRGSAVASPRAPGRDGELWWDKGLALEAWQRHLLQLGYTDRLVGELIARLRRAGLWDRAVVVVTADHGISFRAGDKRRAPTRTNLAELAFVPLFVRRPGEPAAVVDKHVRTVDFLPTIADALGVEIPWQTDGESGFAPGEGADTVKVGFGPHSRRLEAALEQRRASLRRQLDLFGSGSWGNDFFGVGPYESLLGRSVGTLSVSAPTGEARVDQIGSRFLRGLRARSPLVPSPLAGTLTGAQQGNDLAVAVNGRIQAVSTAYREDDGSVRFIALTPESAFRPGRNSVRVFVVSGSAARPTLRELETVLS